MQLPEGINLYDCCINNQQKEQMRIFILRWNDRFGNCDLLKHEINLTDNMPFKEPARRIPPALFQEVKEHLDEMMAAGAVRPSQSPCSSNVVIAPPPPPPPPPRRMEV